LQPLDALGFVGGESVGARLKAAVGAMGGKVGGGEFLKAAAGGVPVGVGVFLDGGFGGAGFEFAPGAAAMNARAGEVCAVAGSMIDARAD